VKGIRREVFLDEFSIGLDPHQPILHSYGSPRMIAKKAMEISPFIVMEVLERAHEIERQEKGSVIHLEVGEPDFNTPSCIIEAAIEALRQGDTHYTHSMGLLELREAIARHYQEKYRVYISPDQIIVTSGTSPALFLIFASLLEPGDEVILSNPCYACYPNFITLLGGVPCYVEVEEKEGFQYTPEKINEKLSKRTKAILLNSPSNPTGNLLSADIMQRIADFSPLIISDEIYHGLVYEGKEHSILEFTRRAFVLNGFSKLYAMTGWRLGYVIAPPEFIRPMQKIQQNFFISASSFVQRGGIAALTLPQVKEEVQRMVDLYNVRRKLMLRKLREIGFEITADPTGAFYVFARADKFGKDSYKLAFDILENAHVAVTPGIDFGKKGEGYLRFSYANSLENIEEGLKRIDQYLNHKIPVS
jgi:aspartate/methionine/tyrosine aminotransferase